MADRPPEGEDTTMLQDFKDFIMRGNVIDLAVAFIIGVAFTAVITSLTDDILMQIVAAILGEPDFSSLTIGLGDAEIYYGSFLTAVVNFLIIAAVLFAVIKAMSAVSNLRKREEGEAEVVLTELDLLAEIRDALREGKGPQA
ncbi:large conductance mechanosensitive channel protein MscL [Rhabdothermincola salaria]|uniref:large conductance mechanosensitive channel protein MscL n=1 Tax=Rhabdothermincola salaria TaxID=2903142 RepID=UPI001E3EE6A8|nr:large conductance mechanosensitive channel protein MscL [Rhabdothermincola salaria]MCD9623746.1 large conductance mechanosensitive channel protein MscL [Rhabdothermincola salaria]